jgi:hypothetical protein
LEGVNVKLECGDEFNKLLFLINYNYSKT